MDGLVPEVVGQGNVALDVVLPRASKNVEDGRGAHC